ncbi:MAG: glycosyltransferase [Lachnospiraceae bacterium]|nr:glycosyltransferase [Lachnospiraceae bacterium]
METYETWGELVEKANYYLTHEEEREAIARAGYEEVKARHTVMHRVSEMIRIILGTME